MDFGFAHHQLLRRTVDFTTCIVCGTKFALVIKESGYNGYRGICLKCEGNWAES